MKGLREKIAQVRTQFDASVKVRLGDVSLQLGTLRSLDEAHATAYAQINGSDKQKGMFLFYLKLGMLALAIRAVDDLDVSGLRPEDEVPGTGKGRFEFVLELLKSLPGDVVDHLYSLYAGLAGKSREALEKAVRVPEIPKPPAVDVSKTVPAPPPQEVKASGDEEGSIADAE